MPLIFGGTAQAWAPLKARWTSFGDLVEDLSDRPFKIPLSKAEFLKLPKGGDDGRDARKRCRWFTPGAYNDPLRRLKENVRSMSLLGLDLDDHESCLRALEAIEAGKLPYAHYLYHTANSTPEAQRMRLLIGLHAPLPPEDYAGLQRGIAKLIGATLVPESLDVARLYYWRPTFEGLDPLETECSKDLVSELIDQLDAELLSIPEEKEKGVAPKAPSSRPSNSFGFEDESGEFDPLDRVSRDLSLTRAASTLNDLDPDMGRDDWLHVAMGLHYGSDGADWAFDLFTDWSSKGSKFEGEKDCRNVWRSMGERDEPVTWASVVVMAREARNLKALEAAPAPDAWDGLGKPHEARSVAYLAGLNLQPEPVMIHSLLRVGARMSLGGGSKTNKTWALIQMAVSAAAGVQWWSFWFDRPLKVLFIDCELGKRLFMERAIAVCHAMGVDPSCLEHLVVRSLKDNTADLETVLKAMKNWIKIGSGGSPFEMVILDPLYTILCRDGADENDNSSVARVLMGLGGACGKAVFVYAQHFSKGNQAGKSHMDRNSGAGAFSRWPDAVMTLTPHQVEGCFTVETTVRAFAPVEPFVVRRVHPLMEVADELDPMELQDGPRSRGNTEPSDEQILRTIPVNREFSWREILTLFEGAHPDVDMPERTLRRRLKELAESGALTKPKYGKYLRSSEPQTTPEENRVEE